MLLLNKLRRSFKCPKRCPLNTRSPQQRFHIQNICTSSTGNSEGLTERSKYGVVRDVISVTILDTATAKQIASFAIKISYLNFNITI